MRRPSPELLARLRGGKERLHAAHASLDLPAKVEQVIELQRLYLPLLERQRPLRSWERVWTDSPARSERIASGIGPGLIAPVETGMGAALLERRNLGRKK